MLDAVSVEPKRHVVADAVSIPARVNIRILRISLVRRAMKNAKAIGDVFVQRAIGLVDLPAVGNYRLVSLIAGLECGSLAAIGYPRGPHGKVITVIFGIQKQGYALLTDVVVAIDALSLRFGPAQCGEQQRGQDCNDGNNDE